MSRDFITSRKFLVIIFSFSASVFLVILLNSFIQDYYDFTPYEKENPLGIDARVALAHNVDFISCSHKPCTTTAWIFMIRGQQPFKYYSYYICKELFCIKKSGFVSYVTGGIKNNGKWSYGNIGDTAWHLPYPWHVGDTIKIKVAVSQYNSTKVMYVDLGQSRVTEFTFGS